MWLVYRMLHLVVAVWNLQAMSLTRINLFSWFFCVPIISFMMSPTMSLKLRCDGLWYFHHEKHETHEKEHD